MFAEISYPMSKHRTPHLSDAQVSEVICLYEENKLTLDEIGSLYGKTGTCIRLIMKKRGIERDFDKRGYVLNDGKFSEPWTEEHSYWLGLMHADGHCAKSSAGISLELQERDSYIVEGFARFIGYSGKVQHFPPHEFVSTNGKTYLSSGTACLSFNSKVMHKDLTDRGIISKNKAIWIPPVGFRDYLRGLFDGNGSISKMKRIGQWEWTYTGGMPACELFIKVGASLGVEVGLQEKIGCWQARVKGGKALTMQKFMYEGNTSAQMSRKAIFEPSEHLWASSGYAIPSKGFCTQYDKGRRMYRVRTQVDGKMVNVGRFKTKGLAWLAFAKDSLRRHGKYSPFYIKKQLSDVSDK